jgi:hypothetical protein
VEVSTDKLFAGFRAGYAEHSELWREVLPMAEYNQVEKLTQIAEERDFMYPSSLWARIIFDFAVAYKNATDEGREELMEALIPFYNSRVLSFVNKTTSHNLREAEEYLEQIQRVFEGEKYYLIERWDQAKDANGRLFG